MWSIYRRSHGAWEDIRCGSKCSSKHLPLGRLLPTVWQLGILRQLGFITIYSQFKTSYSTGEKKVIGKRRQEWCCATAKRTLCTWAEIWKEGAAKMAIRYGQTRDFMEKQCTGHYLSMDFLCISHANLCEFWMFCVRTVGFSKLGRLRLERIACLVGNYWILVNCSSALKWFIEMYQSMLKIKMLFLNKYLFSWTSWMILFYIHILNRAEFSRYFTLRWRKGNLQVCVQGGKTSIILSHFLTSDLNTRL